MTDKQTSLLSTLYQNRKAQHCLPESARKKLYQQTKQQRSSYWKIAVPTVFASFMVVLIIWPNINNTEFQSTVAEPELLMMDSVNIEESFSVTVESEEIAEIELMAEAPAERAAAAPMAKSMAQNDILVSDVNEAEKPALEQSTWLYVESIGPLVLYDCMGNLFEIEMNETLTADTWILVSERQSQWMIEDSQTESPCHSHRLKP